MSRVIPTWRRRASRFALATAALLVLGGAGVVFLASPATATWTTLNGEAFCQCVERNDKGQYRAVFGYSNPTRYVGKIARGENNRISPARLDGVQVTRFDPGTANGAFGTAWVDRNTTVEWYVGSQRVTASWNSKPCGPSVSLPADGNGTGPVIALGLSVLIGAAVVALRRRRYTYRDA